jgi:16S rRNA C967 or C1407 C5-methylase (RsmB/RsmF family)
MPLKFLKEPKWNSGVESCLLPKKTTIRNNDTEVEKKKLLDNWQNYNVNGTLDTCCKRNSLLRLINTNILPRNRKFRDGNATLV